MSRFGFLPGCEPLLGFIPHLISRIPADQSTSQAFEVAGHGLFIIQISGCDFEDIVSFVSQFGADLDVAFPGLGIPVEMS